MMTNQDVIEIKKSQNEKEELKKRQDWNKFNFKQMMDNRKQYSLKNIQATDDVRTDTVPKVEQLTAEEI
jgi:hypothetical protein